jgi:hypothetical protein
MPLQRGISFCCETRILVRLVDSEFQVSEANNLKVTIGALKFVGRTTPERSEWGS